MGTIYVALCAALVGLGNLEQSIVWFWVIHGLMTAVMLLGWRQARAWPNVMPWIVGVAIIARLVVAFSTPSLSDDLYRYLWDGKVQANGIHPYRYAPVDPALVELRDQHWSRINHPTLTTIYPPLAQMLFAALGVVGAGPRGVQLTMALLDIGVILALGFLLKGGALPRDRLVLYAWNPLAIVETAGSAHVEPLGIVCLLLSVAWIIGRRFRLSTAALAAAIHVKLLPLVLIPGVLRQTRGRGVATLLIVLVALWLPYAISGPPLGGGTVAYAKAWEFNATGYALVQATFNALDTELRLKPVIAWLQQALQVEWIPWATLYAYVWPRELARVAIAVVLLAWIGGLCWLKPELGPLRMALWVVGAVLVLSPTVYPWYVLWILPLAVAELAWGWLTLAALMPLAYAATALWEAEANQDVPWWLRCVIYLPAVGVALIQMRRGSR